MLTDQPNDALATALSEVTASGGLVGQDEAGPPQVKDPLSALAAAAELDQVRSDVAVVSVTCTRFSVSFGNVISFYNIQLHCMASIWKLCVSFIQR